MRRSLRAGAGPSGENGAPIRSVHARARFAFTASLLMLARGESAYGLPTDFAVLAAAVAVVELVGAAL